MCTMIKRIFIAFLFLFIIQTAESASPTKSETIQYIIRALRDVRIDFKYEIKKIRGVATLVVMMPDNSDGSRRYFRDEIPLNGDVEFRVDASQYANDSPTSYKFSLYAEGRPTGKCQIKSTIVDQSEKDKNGIWHNVEDCLVTGTDGNTIVVSGNNPEKLVKPKKAIDHLVAIINPRQRELF